MNTKKWYLSKTIWLAVITAVLGILTAVETQYGAQGWIISAVGILNAILRISTTSTIE